MHEAVPTGAIAEADKTKENRGAVGIGHDSSSLTTNAASGTIGGDTPPPLFDRAAIAAGQTGAAVRAEASEWGSGPTTAHGTPTPAARPDVLERAEPVRGSGPVAAGPTPAIAAPEPIVPVGEFDHAETVLEQNKLRIAHGQATIVRDAASALLGLAEPLTVGDPATGELLVDPTLGDDRGDPTLGDDRGDTTATSLAATGHAPSGKLRSSAALPRRRGLLGDLRYIGTVVLGLRSARRELAGLTARQATRQHSRRHHLTTLGRTAVALPEFLDAGPHARVFDHPALGPAREQLAGIEDERSQHAGHVAAADSELTRVRRDREAKAKQYVTDLAAIDSDLMSFAKRLEPLEKEVAGLKRRAADMQESLRRIDAKIAATKASLTQVKGKNVDPADVQAELATLRADRKAIQADEPRLAAELDALHPRIASIEAARSDAQRKRAELEAAEHDDQRRIEELLAAIGAKRKVVDRAAADAEAARDKILFQLGERLYVDRPARVTNELAPVDAIDVELGLADRRMMELREILASVDRWKLVRGIALLVVLLGALGALAGWLLVLRGGW